jgi:S1-C subfamily serine protease
VFEKAQPAALRVVTDPAGVGTAFFISPDGLALTAHHVVRDARRFSVLTSQKTRLNASVVGYDEVRDLALIKVEVKEPVQALEIATSAPKVGEPLLAIGNSCDAFLRPRPGRVTALERDISPAYPTGLIASNMPLAPGDSGGPVLDASGRVVGVSDAIGFGMEGFSSYVAPLYAASQIVSELKSGVRRDVPVLGVLTADLDADTVSGLGTGRPGVLVTSVLPGSGAARAGLRGRDDSRLSSDADLRAALRAGTLDIIVAVDGKTVQTRDDLVGYLRGKRVGDRVELTVWRAGETLKLNVTLGRRAVT